MSLATPEKIRKLQRQLYCKAKAEPRFRFYQLYDKIWRSDILAHAWALSRANRGAPGVDGVTFEQIEAEGLESWLGGLQEELRDHSYRPQAVRRVLIPKPGGGERPLGLPTIKDRVVQTAAKLVLEPIFEADMEDSAYGYRPKRSAIDAVKAVHGALIEGYTQVVDADLSKYFDTIPHDELMRSLALRICLRSRAEPTQKLAEGAGAKRRSRRADLHGRQAKQDGHPARGRDQPAAGQPLHEPVPEVLEAMRRGQAICRQVGELRR